MGTIACEIHAPQATLSCTGNTPKDDWQFHLAGGFDDRNVNRRRPKTALPPHRSSQKNAQDELITRMPVLISMLRGVNVGSHNRIKMNALPDTL